MGIMSAHGERKRKPKLPRKRKKACIKAQGRASYYSTINMAKIDGDDNCKFWVNSTVRYMPYIINGQAVMLPTPTRYW